MGSYSLTNLLISSLFSGSWWTWSLIFFSQPLFRGTEIQYLDLYSFVEDCSVSPARLFIFWGGSNGGGYCPLLCYLIASWFGNVGVTHTFPGAFVKSFIHCFCKLTCTMCGVSNFGLTSQVLWRPDVPEWHGSIKKDTGSVCKFTT